MKYILYIIARILAFTYRYEYYNKEHLEKAKTLSQVKNSYFLALWHQNIMATIFSHLHIPHGVLVSPSKDGELIAYTLKKLDHICIRGSNHRQYFTAMKNILKTINEKQVPVAITVDAPKGPFKSVKRGIIDLAKISQSVILPIYASSTTNWTFEKSWDKFKLPKPFSQIKVFYGSPIIIDKNIPLSDYHIYTTQLYESLQDLEK